MTAKESLIVALKNAGKSPETTLMAKGFSYSRQSPFCSLNVEFCKNDGRCAIFPVSEFKYPPNDVEWKNLELSLPRLLETEAWKAEIMKQ